MILASFIYASIVALQLLNSEYAEVRYLVGHLYSMVMSIANLPCYSFLSFLLSFFLFLSIKSIILFISTHSSIYSHERLLLEGAKL